MAEDRKVVEWNLSEAVDDLRDALFPGDDCRLQSMWNTIREHFGAFRIDEATDPITIGKSIERLLQEDPQELPEFVVRTYAKTDQLFEGEGRDLDLRSTPETCLIILGTLDPEVPLVEQPIPADPTLSVHVSSPILVAKLHEQWLTISGRILEDESRQNDSELREHLAASGGLFLVVAIDGGEALDPEKIQREIRISFEEGIRVLLVGMVESDAQRWPAADRLSSQDLKRYWEMASNRLAETKDRLGYISLRNLWGDDPSQDLSLLAVDQALKALAATGGVVEVRNHTANLLIEAYGDDASIRTILSGAGLRRQDFDLQGKVRDIWYRIVDDMGPLHSEQLVGVAVADPTVESLHEEFRKLGERLKRIQKPGGAAE